MTLPKESISRYGMPTLGWAAQLCGLSGLCALLQGFPTIKLFKAGKHECPNVSADKGVA